jgi:tRNA1(Val) A37 N6-methylase TrmN6
MVIYQPPSGYCYNSDTIFLYDFIKRFPIKGEVLDVGTGSGILALLIKRDFKANVSAVELQEEFVKYAKINAKANKLDIRIYFGNFLHLVFDKRFDFIVSNPPFYHKDVIRAKEKMVDIARYSGYLPMEDFFKKVSTLLKPRGGFIFCYDAKQIQNVLSTLADHKLTVEALRLVHPKKEKEATLAMFYARKSSKSLCRIVEPLVVFEGAEYAKHTQQIFKEVGVHSIKCVI